MNHSMNKKKLNIILKLLILLMVIDSLQCRETSQNCPSYCNCDLYIGRNRADCSSKNLIFANLKIPSAVEFLDLSYNDITHLDENDFKTYRALVNLTISHNAIDTIYPYTFKSLSSVTYIDLSYNRLESIESKQFKWNHHLYTLILAGNKFMIASNQPFLISKSLINLNLCNSQISYLHNEFLQELPMLETLDISRNPMITLNMIALDSIKYLEYINLQENRWNCDHAFKMAIEKLQRNNVNVNLTTCLPSKKSNNTKIVSKFERMEMLPSDNNDETLKISDEMILDADEDDDVLVVNEINDTNDVKPLSDIWRSIKMNNFDDDDDTPTNNLNHNSYDDDNDDENLSTIFQRLKCSKSKSNLCMDYQKCVQQLDDLLIQKKSTKSIIDLNFETLFGVAVGVSAVVSLLSIIVCCRYLMSFGRKERHHNELIAVPVTRIQPIRPIIPSTPRSNTSEIIDETLQHLDETPVRTRRHRNSRPQSHHHTTTTTTTAIVRHHSNRNNNFIASLFGRPARHQYYQAINQNATNLIRTLSRNNLFSNRNQRTTQQQNDYENNNEDDSERYSTSMQQRRPETPPPDYVEVVGVHTRLNK